MKLKDYITLGNLLAGLGAVVALIEHDFDAACYLVFIAYVFDNLDGPVARLTKQFDEFGAHLDTACDFVSNSIAAPFLIYYAFRFHAGYAPWLAASIAAVPAALGTIRQAKGGVESLSYPGYFLGLPRPASALLFIALINSSLWRVPELRDAWGWLIYPASALIVVAVSVLHVNYFPFASNKHRRWLKWMWIGKHAFLTLSPIVFLVGWLGFDYPAVIFDYICFCLSVYIFLSWTQIPKGDWRRIRHYIKTREVLLPLVHTSGEWRPQGFLLPVLEDTTAWDEEIEAAERRAREGEGGSL